MIRNLIIIIGAIAAVLFGANAMAQGNHVAHCDGGSEVPPFDTQGQCQAIFKVRNGTLSYKLNGANLENVVAAHIHCAPEGSNGAVGVTLFLGAPVTVTGTLVQGPILAPDANNGCGWVDLDDVLDAIATGDTYVNIHTLQNLAGEVRGQIR
jgi:hypothetical protein